MTIRREWATVLKFTKSEGYTKSIKKYEIICVCQKKAVPLRFEES